MPRDPRRSRKTRPENPGRTVGRPAQQASSSARSGGATRRSPLHPAILWSLLGLLLLYISIGVWPILPVEGDETAIANGAAKLVYTPQVDRNTLYRYHFQPLPHVVLALGERTLGLDTLASFGALTLVGFVSFLGFGSLFISRQTEVPLPAAAIILLLFQETFVSAYYPNTTIIAAGFLAPAAVLLTRATWWADVLAAILFSLAVVSRFDSLLMAPAMALIPLTLRRDRVVGLIVFTVVAALSFLLMQHLMGISLDVIRHEATEHRLTRTDLPWAIKNFRTIFNPLLCLLFIAGIAVCLVRQRWKLVLLALAGTLPLVLVYGRSITTPKYLVCAILLFALPVAVALRSAVKLPDVRWRTLVVLFLVGAFVQQYFYGLFTSSVTNDLKRPQGDVLWTADSYRMQNSFALAPFLWYLAKSYGADQLAIYERQLHQYLEGRPSGEILAATGGFWLTNTVLEYEMRRAGFFPPNLEQEPSGSSAAVNQVPWKTHVFQDRTARIFKIYNLTEQEPANQSPSAFLAHQRRIQPAPASPSQAWPYSFLFIRWGDDCKYLDRPMQCQRVDCDLRNAGTPKR